MVRPVQGLMTHIYLQFGLVLILAGCAATPQAAPGIEGTWQLVSGNIAGQPFPLVDGHPINLQVEGTKAASCTEEKLGEGLGSPEVA